MTAICVWCGGKAEPGDRKAKVTLPSENQLGIRSQSWGCQSGKQLGRIDAKPFVLWTEAPRGDRSATSMHVPRAPLNPRAVYGPGFQGFHARRGSPFCAFCLCVVHQGDAGGYTGRGT